MSDREKFLYVQIDIDLFDHPKAAKVGAGGVGVFAAAVGYCRKHKTDGLIPRRAAMALLFGDGAKFFDDLVDVGWFIERGDEIEVWNYAKKNQTKAQIEAAKSAARERMKRVRANERRTSGEHQANIERTFVERSSSGSPSLPMDNDPGREGSEQEQAARQRTPGGDESGVHRAAPLADPAGEFEIGERWRDGVAEGSSARPARPMGAELRKLVALVYDRVPPGGGVEGQRARSQWAFDFGRTYGEAHREQTRNVHRFVDWVGSGCLAVATRSARAPFARQPLAPARAPPSFSAKEALREGQETMRRMAKGEF